MHTYIPSLGVPVHDGLLDLVRDGVNYSTFGKEKRSMQGQLLPRGNAIVLQTLTVKRHA
jgi:hypothetical protein